MILCLAWLTDANAAEPMTPPAANFYQNSEHRYRITFPDGWVLAKPNQTFTHVKARAPTGGYAAMSVACRDGLWQGDGVSKGYPDSWKALDGVSMSTFTNRFERNAPAQTATVSSVEKTTVRGQKALKVDYVLIGETKAASVRIRSFFILHGGRWYSISCATLKSQPDIFLDAMLKSVATFEFYSNDRTS
jgi:hypothetical protein